MQKQLDTIYVNLCRDYIKKKKEQVKEFKLHYIKSMS